MGTCANSVRVPEDCGHRGSTKRARSLSHGGLSHNCHSRCKFTPDIVLTALPAQTEVTSVPPAFSQCEVLWFSSAELKDIAFLHVCYR